LKKYVDEKARLEKASKKSNFFSGKKDEEEAAGATGQEEITIPKTSKKAGKERKAKASIPTEVEKEMKEMREITLEYEKGQLIQEMANTVEGFDSAIRDLCNEKKKLEVELKVLDMKFIIFYQELLELNSMEDRDVELLDKLEDCRNHKIQNINEIAEITAKFEVKEQEIAALESRKQELMDKFKELVPENSAHYDKLFEILNKKIKRKKPKQKDSDDEDEESDEYDSDEDYDDDDDDDDDDEAEGMETCPPDCNMNTFDAVIQLRENRLDIVDESTEIDKIIDELQKKKRSLLNTQDSIDKDLKATEAEIQAFQKEKLKKLNKLTTSVMLKLDKVQNLVKSEGSNQPAIPSSSWHDDHEDNEEEADASHHQNEEGFLQEEIPDSVLFTRERLAELKSRIGELRTECIEVSNRHKADRRKHKANIKTNEEIQEEKERLTKEFIDMQLLKFGKKINLDLLDASTPTLTVEELQKKYNDLEKRSIRQIEDCEDELRATKEQLKGAIKRNTILLNGIITLGKAQREHNKTLDSTNKQIFVQEEGKVGDDVVQMTGDLREKLEMNAREIETLKAEINLFRRKGGHIYTTVTANRRAANNQMDN